MCGPLPGVDYDSAQPSDLEETVALVEKEGRRAVAARVYLRVGGRNAPGGEPVARRVLTLPDTRSPSRGCRVRMAA